MYVVSCFIISDMGRRTRFFSCSVYFVGSMLRPTSIAIPLKAQSRFWYILVFTKTNIKILFKYDSDLILKRNVEKYNNSSEIYSGWFWWTCNHNGSGNYGTGRHRISGIREEVHGEVQQHSLNLEPSVTWHYQCKFLSQIVTQRKQGLVIFFLFKVE